MQGREFGVGMAAGLLVALSIVALSGVTAAPLASPVSNTSGSSSSYVTQTATTPTVNSGAVNGKGATETASVPPSTNSVSTTTGSTVSAGNGVNPAGLNSFASIAGMSQLSSLSRVFVLAPIIVAVLLGAILYRISGGSRKE